MRHRLSTERLGCARHVGSLHVSHFVTRTIWRRRGVSPLCGRTHRVQKDESLHYLLVPMDPPVDFFHPARYCARTVRANKRGARASSRSLHSRAVPSFSSPTPPRLLLLPSTLINARSSGVTENSPPGRSMPHTRSPLRCRNSGACGAPRPRPTAVLTLARWCDGGVMAPLASVR